MNQLGVSYFADAASNFHPYECDGPGGCVHCDRLTTAAHDPLRCALCVPEYQPEPDPDAKYDWDRDTLALDIAQEPPA